MNIWTRDEILLKLLTIQIGMQPPVTATLAESIAEFRRCAGDDAIRWERGADFFFTEISALQKKIADLERAA